MESFPTVWSLLWPLPPLLRLMLKPTPRLTPGCTITGLAMLPVPMVMDIMAITWATMARGPPRLNQLLRLMLKLPQRPTPGCTTPMLDTDSTHTDMATMAMVWATLPMPGYHPYSYYGG